MGIRLEALVGPPVDALDIGCPTCGARPTAQVGAPDPAGKPVGWTCPFCRREHAHDFGGRLEWVAPHPGSTRRH